MSWSSSTRLDGADNQDALGPLLCNVATEPVDFTLPGAHYARAWQVGLTTVDGFEANPRAGSVLEPPARAVVVLVGVAGE